MLTLDPSQVRYVQPNTFFFLCQSSCNVSTFSFFVCNLGTWTVCEDRITLSQIDTSNTIQPALVGSIHRTDLVNDEVLPSARLPGALEVEPLVRKLTTNSGLTASDNAVWMLLVAIREHSSSIIRKVIANDKDLANGYAPRVPSHFQTSLACQKDTTAHDGDNVKPSGKEKSERRVINSTSLSHVLAENPSATSRLTSMYSDMAPDNKGSSSIPDLGNVNSIINSSIQRAAHRRQKHSSEVQSVVPLAAGTTSKSSTLVPQAGNNVGGVSQSNSAKSQSSTTMTTLPTNPLPLNQQPKFVTQPINQLYPGNIQMTTQPPQSFLASMPFQNNMQQIHPGPQQQHAGNYFSQSQAQSPQQFMLIQKMQQFYQEQQRFIPPTLPQAHLTLPPQNKQNVQQSHSAQLMSHTNHTPKGSGGTTNQQTPPTMTIPKPEALTKPGFPGLLTNNSASKESEKQAPKTSSTLPIDPTQTSPPLAQDPKRVVSSSPPTRVIKRGSKNLASLTKPTPQPSPVTLSNTSGNNDDKIEPLDTKKDTETAQKDSHDAKDNLDPAVKSDPSARPNPRSKRFGSKNLAALRARASFSDK